MKIRFYSGTLFALLVFTAVPVQRMKAEDPWVWLEPGISVRKTQVTKETCTWGFRNDDTSRTLAAMRFDFPYTPLKQAGGYNPYDKTTNKDILPYPLKPGAVVGGWAAYTAPANCYYLTFTVTYREWK